MIWCIRRILDPNDEKYPAEVPGVCGGDEAMIDIGKNDIYTFADCPCRHDTFHSFHGCWYGHEARWWVNTCDEVREEEGCPRGFP